MESGVLSKPTQPPTLASVADNRSLHANFTAIMRISYATNQRCCISLVKRHALSAALLFTTSHFMVFEYHDSGAWCEG